LADRLFYLISQLLPVTDKIPSLISGHHFGALLFEDGDHRLRIHSNLFSPVTGRLPQGLRHAIKLGVYTRLDPLRPLDLAWSSRHLAFLPARASP